MLSKVLAHKVNFGYHNFGPQLLHAFNGVVVKNLAHLLTLVESSSAELYEFAFHKMNDESSSEQATILIVLDAKQCKEATPEIFSQHMIQSASLLQFS
jgi:hypothetical protein